MGINYKVHFVGLITIIALTMTVNYFKTPWRAGLSEDFAKKRVKEVLMDTTVRPWTRGKDGIILVKTREAAISIAEAILFDIYGEEKILAERPYGVHKIDVYWFVSGSLPRLYTFGGGFEIIIDSRDAGVISVTHYK